MGNGLRDARTSPKGREPRPSYRSTVSAGLTRNDGAIVDENSVPATRRSRKQRRPPWASIDRRVLAVAGGWDSWQNSGDSGVVCSDGEAIDCCVAPISCADSDQREAATWLARTRSQPKVEAKDLAITTALKENTAVASAQPVGRAAEGSAPFTGQAAGGSPAEEFSVHRNDVFTGMDDPGHSRASNEEVGLEGSCSHTSRPDGGGDGPAGQLWGSAYRVQQNAAYLPQPSHPEPSGQSQHGQSQHVEPGSGSARPGPPPSQPVGPVSSLAAGPAASGMSVPQRAPPSRQLGSSGDRDLHVRLQRRRVTNQKALRNGVGRPAALEAGAQTVSLTPTQKSRRPSLPPTPGSAVQDPSTRDGRRTWRYIDWVEGKADMSPFKTCKLLPPCESASRRYSESHMEISPPEDISRTAASQDVRNSAARTVRQLNLQAPSGPPVDAWYRLMAVQKLSRKWRSLLRITLLKWGMVAAARNRATMADAEASRLLLGLRHQVLLSGHLVRIFWQRWRALVRHRGVTEHMATFGARGRRLSRVLGATMAVKQCIFSKWRQAVPRLGGHSDLVRAGPDTAPRPLQRQRGRGQQTPGTDPLLVPRVLLRGWRRHTEQQAKLSASLSCAWRLASRQLRSAWRRWHGHMEALWAFKARALRLFVLQSQRQQAAAFRCWRAACCATDQMEERMGAWYSRLLMGRALTALASGPASSDSVAAVSVVLGSADQSVSTTDGQSERQPGVGARPSDESPSDASTNEASQGPVVMTFNASRSEMELDGGVRRLKGALRELEAAANARITEQNSQLRRLRAVVRSLSGGYRKEVGRRRLAMAFSTWRRTAALLQLAAIPYYPGDASAGRPSQARTSRAGGPAVHVTADIPSFHDSSASQEEIGSQYLEWLNQVGGMSMLGHSDGVTTAHGLNNGTAQATEDVPAEASGSFDAVSDEDSELFYEYDFSAGHASFTGVSPTERFQLENIPARPRRHAIPHELRAADGLLQAIPQAASSGSGHEWGECWEKLQAVVEMH